MFDAQIIADARRHARVEYPRESCGLVVSGRYFACKNIAESERDFVIDPIDQARALMQGELEAVIHSHPDGPYHPTRSDMIGQIETDVPWIILPTDGADRIGDPIIWGANTPIAPLVGRQFKHGVTDCYSIIRDAYRLGMDGMAAQGIFWPFYEPIELPEVARDDAWWMQQDQDLYQDLFAKFGFVEINYSEARPGDVFLIKVNHEKLNHGGILVGNNLLIQHFPNRLSRREPAGLWARHADKWIRYVGGDQSKFTDQKEAAR
jgi:proteasome lid subunit RPN8/RPN11